MVAKPSSKKRAAPAAKEAVTVSDEKRARLEDGAPGQPDADQEMENLVYDGTYKNKQRVLVLCSRGIVSRHRHFMEDIKLLLPHHKKENKFDSKGTLQVINDIAEMKGCNNCIYLETRKRQDLYMWISRTPNGPSAKFRVLNVHTMDELKLTGNAMRGSRPLLSFDTAFDSQPYLKLIKGMFVQVWGTPRGHPKSKPFIDRMMSFCFLDNKIWVRNWQIIDEGGNRKEELVAAHKGEDLTQLVEIGPRFVLDPIRIFDGSFGGATLYQSPSYVSPNELRREQHTKHHNKYANRVAARQAAQQRKAENVMPKDELEDVFKAE